MKKQLSLTISCLLLMAGLALGQTQSINLYTMGSTTQTSATVNSTDAFSLDTYVTFSGYSAIGLSYWLQVPDALAPFISGTGESYFTWTDPNQTFFGSDSFDQMSGTDPGFMNEDRDLGATSIFAGGMFQQVAAAGTYQVSTLNFSLSGAPAGTYEIRTTILSPKVSQITEGNSTTSLGSHPFDNQAVYTLTVVPEPATWSLLGLGGIASLGLTCLRARRRS